MRTIVAIVTMVLVAMAAGIPSAAWAEFTEDHLIVVNELSAASAGIDSLIEFDPAGTRINTLVP